MRYYINISDGYIESISTVNLDGEGNATEKQYAAVKALFVSKPTAADGYDYKLTADLEWELVELPPMPEDDELTAEEALDIITGGGAE